MQFIEQYVSAVGSFGLNTKKDAYFGGSVNFASPPTDFYVTVGSKNATYVTDGVADDVQINAAITAVNAAGGGTVFLKSGTYTLASSIKPKSYVHLRGDNMFTTILTTTSTITGGIIADISFTINNQLVNFICSDLELDGSNMPTSPYSIGRKGIDSHFLQYCVFKDLYIHNTPATALGTDNLDRCLIDHVICVNCGTAGQSQGSNGIGIGTGGNTHESFIVTNCITVGTANSGFLAEQDDSTTTDGHYIFANNVSYGDNKGFQSSGATDITFANNQVYGATGVGINCIVYVTHVAKRINIIGNEIDSSASYGIYLDTGVSDSYMKNNRVTNGTVEGIVVRGPRNSIIGNHVHNNGKSGIFIGAAGGGSAISHVSVNDNYVYDNAIVTANTDGIRIDATSAALSDISVHSNHSFDDQGTPTQRYGVIVTGSSGITNLSIRNNDTVSNKTAGLFNNAGGTLTGISIRDNFGINPPVLYAQGNVTGATTFNRANGAYITATLTGNITVTLTAGVSSGDMMTLELTQDATGSRTATWPSNFKKAGGTLVLTTTASATDIILMQWDGTNWVEISRALNVS